ncbi:hypothetical protein ACLB2K_038040 [Fragaria x ananassa]
MSHRNIYSAATLGLGVERDDHHEVDQPYQEESTSEIPNTEDIRINNDFPPTEDFIGDQYEDSDVLVVQEKHCSPSCIGFWKIPTGFIVESEEIFTGAVREVKEETGIDTEFVEVRVFRIHMSPLMKRKSRQEAFKRCYEQAVQQLGPRPANPQTVAAPPLES